MISIRETYLNSEILKELNYSFGDIFIFDGFIVSEIKAGVNFNWSEHANQIAQDVAYFLGTDGSDLIYISNRVNSYAVVALDWLKFFKNSYFLKGYYVVSERPSAKLNLMVESLFFNHKIKSFNSIYTAINWAKKGTIEVA